LSKIYGLLPYTYGGKAHRKWNILVAEMYLNTSY